MDARLLIAIVIGIIWLVLRLLRRRPEDTGQQEQRGGDVIFTESEVNLPWQQIPQGRQMLEEYDEEEEVEQVREELKIESVEAKEEPSISRPASPPAPSMEPKQPTSSQMTSDTPARSQQSSRQPKQIAGIPLNTKSVKFGIVLSEILNKPKSQRPQIK